MKKLIPTGRVTLTTEKAACTPTSLSVFSMELRKNPAYLK